MCWICLRVDGKGMRKRIKIERGEKLFEEIIFLLGGNCIELE